MYTGGESEEQEKSGGMVENTEEPDAHRGTIGEERGEKGEGRRGPHTEDGKPTNRAGST